MNSDNLNSLLIKLIIHFRIYYGNWNLNDINNNLLLKLETRETKHDLIESKTHFTKNLQTILLFAHINQGCR